MIEQRQRLGERRPKWPLAALPAGLVGVVALAVLGGGDHGTRRTGGGLATATAASATSPPSREPDATTRAGRVVEVGIAPGPMALVAGHGAVWVASASDASVRALDPRTAQVRIVAEASSPGADQPPGMDEAPLVAVAGGSVWTATSPARHDLVRVDPSSGRIVARVAIDDTLTGILGDGRGTWVTTDAGTVVRIDPGTNEQTASVDAGSRPVHAALGPTSLWVSSGDRVLRLDPTNGRVLAEIRGGGGPIGVRDEIVWARAPGSLAPALVGIDEATGRVVERADIATSGRAELAWSLPGLDTADLADEATRYAPRQAQILDVGGITWLVRSGLGEVWRIEGR